jgi:hypothetical protein
MGLGLGLVLVLVGADVEELQGWSVEQLLKEWQEVQQGKVGQLRHSG